MKSERRHELRNNSLDSTLRNLPALLRLHANKILMGVVVIIVFIFLIRFRNSSALQQRESLKDSLASVRSRINELANMERSRMNPEQVALARKQVLADVNTNVDNILAGADEDDQAALRAEAILARGETYWNLATAQALPGAATQPTLQLPESEDALLKKSEAQYQQVVSSYSTQVPARVSALFALAAIAEQRRDFEQARKQYTTIVDGSDVPDIYKNIAIQRREVLTSMKDQPFVGALNVEAATQPSSPPTTQPLQPMMSSSGAATAPATQPVP